MKLKLNKNNNLNLELSNIQKNKIDSLYIVECPRINAFEIAKSVLYAGDNLKRIRISGVNEIGPFSVIDDFSKLKGINITGEEIETPIILGSYYITDWVLESEYNRVKSAFSTVSNNLNIYFSNNITKIAYDSGTNYIHFTETTVPDITNKTFDLGDFDIIYVGNGSSYYNDQLIVERYKEAWSQYSNKIRPWFNYSINLPNNYTYTPYIMSDGIEYLNLHYSINGNTDFLVDGSFVFKPNGDYSLYGSSSSGFKGTESGLSFYVSDKTGEPGSGEIKLESDGSYLDSDIEAVYRANLKTLNFYKNGQTIKSLTNRTSLGGNITLFGDDNATFVGKLYYVKVSEGNDVMLNLIPCYTTIDDNVFAGLYDTVNDEFYTSVNYWCPESIRYIGAETEGDNIITENYDNLIY